MRSALAETCVERGPLPPVIGTESIVGRGSLWSAGKIEESRNKLFSIPPRITPTLELTFVGYLFGVKFCIAVCGQAIFMPLVLPLALSL